MEKRIEVILVNEQDEEIGIMEKLAVHQQPQLHRAFSVFIFNSKKEMLLQRRASTKYHSPGLWTNACCGHPQPNEITIEAASKRLTEEIGLISTLQYAFQFIYRAEVGNGLIEHELDHVFIAISDVLPILNPEEADAYDYLPFEEIKYRMAEQPDNFTAWFKIVFDRVEKYMQLEN